MSDNRPMPAARLGLWLILAFGLGSPGSAWAGPGRYDPDQRGFRLTYTFANMPKFGMTENELLSLGQLVPASPDVDSKIRAYHQSASQILYDLTEGRAKILSFTYVDNIKKADVIISLDGDFGRAGWATPGGIGGRPGQVGLYYQTLAKYPERQAVLTVAHELCHYIFALPDEYKENDTRPQCPESNPNGPGCLMDNYFARNGYLGTCTKDSHNAKAPNPGNLVDGHKVTDDCHFWVDEFFKQFPSVQKGAQGQDASGLTNPPPPSSGTPFSGKFKNLVDAAILQAKKNPKTQEILRQRSKVEPGSGALAAVGSIIKKYLTDQLAQTSGLDGMVSPTDGELNEAIRFAAREALREPATETGQFVGKRALVENLIQKALSLAGNLAATTGREDVLAQLFGIKSDATTQAVERAVTSVSKGLLEFLKKDPKVEKRALSPPELTFVDQVARDAVKKARAPSAMENYVEAAKLHIEISQRIWENTIDLGSEIDLPGIENRRTSYKDVLSRLEKLALPGKPFTGFGRRRTFILAPQPSEPTYDYVDLDAGDRLPYFDLRQEIVTNLVQLLERERIEFVNSAESVLTMTQNRFDGRPTIDQPVQRPALTSVQRQAVQLGEMNRMIEEIRRNRVENVILVVPPGGVPAALSDRVEALRSRVINDGDVRIDVILFGTATIPLRLRDLVAQTRGTVQTVADIDELGLAAQRLKNDLGSGSWLSPPEIAFVRTTTPTTDTEQRQSVSREIQANPKGVNSLENVRKKYLGEPDQGTPRDPSQKRGYPIFRGDSDLARFQAKLNIYMKYFTRGFALPAEYSDVRETSDRLYRLADSINEVRQQLATLNLGGDGQFFDEQFTNLLNSIYEIKRDIRLAYYGSTREAASKPLFETDDLFAWTLAKQIAAFNERCLEAQQDQDIQTAIGNFIQVRSTMDYTENALSHEAIYALEQAALRDVSARRIHSELENAVTSILISNPQLKRAQLERPKIVQSGSDPNAGEAAQPRKPADTADSSKGREEGNPLGDLLSRVDEIDKFSLELAKEPVDRLDRLAAERLRRAATYRLIRVEAEVNSKPEADQLDCFLIIDSARRAVWDLRQYLESTRDSDFTETFLTRFDRVIARMEARLPQLERPSNDGAQPPPLLAPCRRGLSELKQSLSDLRTTILAQPKAGASDRGSRILKMEKTQQNALTPLPGSLQKDPSDAYESYEEAIGVVVKQDTAHDPLSRLSALKELLMVPQSSDPPKVSGDKFNEQSILGKYLVSARARRLVDSDFPMMLQSTLVQLQELERDLQLLMGKVSGRDTKSLPLYDRLAGSRSSAPTRLDATDDGSIHIRFRPIVLEESDSRAGDLDTVGTAPEFEFTIGLSRPLYSFDELRNDVPVLQLYQGGEPINAPYLQFDGESSRATRLVFRAPRPMNRDGQLPSGEFEPRLSLKKRYLPIVGRDNALNLVFSVATPRPNVQLIAALRQPRMIDDKTDLQRDKNFAYRNIIQVNENAAIVEVQVLAGASVLNAKVTGHLHAINPGVTPINFPKVDFYDNGIPPDLKKDDGIYTGRIVMEEPKNRKPTEYRVFVAAEWQPECKFIDLFEKIPIPEDDPQKATVKTKDNEKAPPRVPKFRRATSLNFFAESEQK